MNRLLLSPQLSNIYRRIKNSISATYSGIYSRWNKITPSASTSILEETLTPAGLRVLGFLRNWCTQTKNVFPSQHTIAQETGLARSTVQLALADLERHDIIFIERKGHKKSNWYYLNDYFLFKAALFSLLLLASRYRDSENRSLLYCIDLSISESRDRELFYGRMREENAAPISKEIKREEKEESRRAMNKESLDFVHKYHDKNPIFTAHGIIKLAVYPVEILKAVLSRPLKLSAHNLFAYIMGSCSAESKKRGLSLDWSGYRSAKIAMEIPSDDEVYIDADSLEKLKQQREASKQPSSYQQGYQRTTASVPRPVMEYEPPKPKHDPLEDKIKAVATLQQTVDANPQSFAADIARMGIKALTREIEELTALSTADNLSTNQIPLADKLSTTQTPRLVSDNLHPSYVQIHNGE